MRSSLRLFLASLSLASTVAFASEASATAPCNCLEDFTSPTHESVGVPTNGRVFVSARGLDTSSVTLTNTDDGSSVGIEIAVPGSLEHQVVVVPDEPLAPDTAYELAYLAQDAESPITVSFRTGTGKDAEPPTFDVVTISGDGGIAGACEENISAGLVLEGAVDETTPFVDLVVRVALESGDVVFIQADNPVLGRMATADEAWDSCLDNVPEAELDETFRAELHLLDWAGNESVPASNEFTFTERSGEGSCFCSTVGGPGTGGAGGAFALVAMGMVVGRRRLARK